MYSTLFIELTLSLVCSYVSELRSLGIGCAQDSSMIAKVRNEFMQDNLSTFVQWNRKAKSTETSIASQRQGKYCSHSESHPLLCMYV
jgi:hypothetical protein